MSDAASVILKVFQAIKPTPLARSKTAITIAKIKTALSKVRGTVTGQKRTFAGCIARRNLTHNNFSVYCPIGQPLRGVGLGIADTSGTCLYGACGQTNGFGGVTPAPPPNTLPAVVVPVKPPAAQDGGTETDQSLFANPMFWLAVAGGVAVVGGGVIYYRRRHA